MARQISSPLGLKACKDLGGLFYGHLDRLTVLGQSQKMNTSEVIKMRAIKDLAKSCRSGVWMALLLVPVAWTKEPAVRQVQSIASQSAIDPKALPAHIVQLLQKAGISLGSLSVMVKEVPMPTALASSAQEELPILSHLATQLRTPASLMKLVTTQAALDMLGPHYIWKTDVFITGPIRPTGVLEGDVILRGGLDPKMTVENATHLLQKLRSMGVQNIQGDVLIDKGLFEAPDKDPGQFDGEPLRPYNVFADALLINFNALLVSFTPDPLSGVAHIDVEPRMKGLTYTKQVPLNYANCLDYRQELKANFSQALDLKFNGTFAASCGSKIWPLAFSKPKEFTQRALGGIWQNLGGEIAGSFKLGGLPAKATLLWSENSLPLSDVVKDMNKFSNNVMAQHLFLSLSMGLSTGVNERDSREMVQKWWREKISLTPLLIEQGSGLSREERVSAQGLTDLLSYAWLSPYMPELISSLPITGLDGTLKKNQGTAFAHLKTGSLRDVNAIAGFVQGRQQKRYILVAILNDPKAKEGGAVLQGLMEWVANR